jgi:hypothetical protein
MNNPIYVVYVLSQDNKKLYFAYVPSKNAYVLKDTMVGSSAFKIQNEAENFIDDIELPEAFIEVHNFKGKERHVPDEPTWLGIHTELN